MLPIIAVVADALPGTAPALNQRYAPYAPAPLTAALQAAGGLPIILPVPKDPEQAAVLATAYASTFAGLILPGGPDVAPGRYGEEPLAACGAADPARDAFELALVAAAQAAHRPVLAICRGLQVYNVALGGTLYQDLPTQDPDYRLRHRQSSDEAAPSHRVAIAAGSRTAGLVGTDCLVNSRHH